MKTKGGEKPQLTWYFFWVKESLKNACPNAIVAIWCNLVLSVLYLQTTQSFLLHNMQRLLWSTKMIKLGWTIRNACGNISGLSWFSNSIFTWVNCIKRAYMMDGPHTFYMMEYSIYSPSFSGFRKGHDLVH